MTQRQPKFSFLSMLASFLLAVGLWVYVSMNAQYTTVVDLPLLVSLPDSRAIETPIPKNIRAQVRGVGWQLFNMHFSFPPRCIVKVTEEMLQREQTAFRLTSKILEQSIQLPTNVAPLGFIPDTISFDVGTISRKKVPMHLSLDVRLRDGFIITGKPHVEPDSVTLLGNRHILDKVRYWRTEPIVLHDLYKPIGVQANLSDSLGNIIQLSRPSVSVYFNVQQIAEKTFDYIPVELLSAPANHNIILQPAIVSLTVRGGINQISILEQSDIKLYVDYANVMQNNTGVLFPQASLPADIAVLNTVPSRIRYVRRIEK